MLASPGGLVQTEGAGLTHRAADSVGRGGAWEFAFVNSQETLLLLVNSLSHSENHCLIGFEQVFLTTDSTQLLASASAPQRELNF